MKERILYVSKKRGRDTEHSPLRPYRTLGAAVNAARELLQSEKPVSVYIAIDGGEYVEPSVIRISAEDMACPDSTLTIAAQGEKRPVFTSARSIAGSEFKKVKGKPYYLYEMKDEERLPDGSFPAFRDFYCNGKRAVLAENDHFGNLPFAPPNERNRKAADYVDTVAHKLYVDPKMIEGMTTDTDPMPELWIRVEWQIHCVHIESINRRDQKDGFVAVKIPDAEFAVFMRSYCMALYGRPYKFKNSLSLLQHKNDFFYDRKNGHIYYYPESAAVMKDAVLSYPTLENLIILDGASNVTLRNLAFTGVTSNFVTDNGYITGQCGYIKKDNLGFLTHAAVYGKYCHNIRVEGCDFYELGTDALHFNMRTTDLTVFGCSFRNLAATAVRIGRPVGKWDDKENAAIGITVENNYISGTGLTFNSNPAIFLGLGVDVKINHNTIKNSAYSGISVGWSWGIAKWPLGENINLINVEIAYNYVDDFINCMRDGGAIYTLGGNAWEQHESYVNFMHHNYMVTGENAGEGIAYRVMYHDQGSSHWHDYDNVIVAREDNPPATAFIIGGSMNQLIERTYIFNYFLPTPKSVHGPDGESGVVNIVERDTHRGLGLYNMPSEARDIVLSTGCSFCPAVPPTPHEYAHKIHIYLDAKNGSDRHSGTREDAPCATVAHALKTARDVFLTKSDAEVKLLFKNGSYAIDRTLFLNENDFPANEYRLIFEATEAGTVDLECSARIGFDIKNVSNICFRNLDLHSRNASIGSSLMQFENASHLSFHNCRFSRINASAMTFTGITKDVEIESCEFTHIGGYALSFGAGRAHDTTNGNEVIAIRNCLFDAIGYVFEDSPAVRFDVVKKLTVTRNSFCNLSYEALVLGTGDGPVEYGFGKDYNVLRINVSENYIADYMLSGKYGAAIRTAGGNCTHFSHNPFNIIDRNYIEPGDRAGGDGSDYAVFLHGKGASHWHTRFNIVRPSARHASVTPLCRFLDGAYSSWADENTVITSAETVFCDEKEIVSERDLHDKLTHFVSPDEVGDDVKRCIENAGCTGRKPTVS